MVFSRMYKDEHLIRRRRCAGSTKGLQARGLRLQLFLMPVTRNLPIREARGFLGDAAKELHRLDPERQALAVLALIHVEAGEFADAVEAVGGGVGGGGGGGGGAAGRGGVVPGG